MESATFGPANTHVVEIGGLLPGNEFDRVEATGTLNLGGTITIVPIDWARVFTFQVGQSFEIMTFAAATGDFSSYTGLELGGGLRLQPSWNRIDSRCTVVSTDLVGDLNHDEPR